MKTSKLITASLVSITACSGAVLASSSSFADNDSATDTTTVTIPVSCMMSGTVDAPHSAELAPGTYSAASESLYENGIGKTTLTTYCNDYNGFSLYAIGFTGDSYDSENHTKLVGTSASGNTTIPTGVYTTGDTASSWSMKVTKVTDSTTSYNPNNMSITNSFDTWHVIPSTYAQVAQYKATTGSSATDQGTNALGAKVETTYAAYIAPTQAADTYTGQVKYVMVHPYSEVPLQPQVSASGKICYYANASNVEGAMGCQDVASEVTLLASNFSRTGYGFAGWSDKFDYATNNEAHFYGPNETLSIPDTSIYTGEGKGLSLYAVWVKSQGNLQDTAKVTSICNGLTTAPINGTANLSSVSAFADSRDNNTYAIARLADGKCWMIENLRLDDSATLTLVNTNNPLNDGATVTLKHNYTDANTSATLSSTSSVAYNADTAPDGWCTDSYAACYDQSRLRADNTASRATGNPNTNSGSMYSYGNYYNWYSATAGNGTYSKSSGDVVGDLCPNGWRLPQAKTTSAGFGKLDVEMGGTGAYQTSADASNRWRKFPVNTLYPGYVTGGSLTGRGSGGFYWSSTVSDNFGAWSLSLYSSGMNPGTDGYLKYYGGAVRCVAGS